MKPSQKSNDAQQSQTVSSSGAVAVRKRRRSASSKDYLTLQLMALPAVVAMALFAYWPMFGLVLAFKKYNVAKGILGSDWIGLKNFEFLFASTDAWRITRNTVCYNAVFIVLNMFLAVLMALLLNELHSRRLAKVLQTIYIMPHFLSMTAVALIVYAFLSPTSGLLNSVLNALGMESHSWYQETTWWPVFFVIISAWKSVGYNTIVYLASIAGISTEYYEAAMLDGASKWQQARYITIPELKSMITILLIMAVGGIFRGDFGMFYSVTRNSGPLYPVTDVIDTYIYRAMAVLNNQGMATAAGLFQSLVGFVLIMVTNKIVTKIEPDNALF